MRKILVRYTFLSNLKGEKIIRKYKNTNVLFQPAENVKINFDNSVEWTMERRHKMLELSVWKSEGRCFF